MGVRMPGVVDLACFFPIRRIRVCLAETVSARSAPAISATHRTHTFPFFFSALVVSSTCGRPLTSIGLPHTVFFASVP